MGLIDIQQEGIQEVNSLFSNTFLLKIDNDKIGGN
jgi:hypothetical protein